MTWFFFRHKNLAEKIRAKIVFVSMNVDVDHYYQQDISIVYVGYCPASISCLTFECFLLKKEAGVKEKYCRS